MAGRFYAYLVSAVVLVAVAYPVTWPVAWPGAHDSFPLSNYPMFSRPLPQPSLRLVYAVGVERDSTRHHLPPSVIANEEVLQARAVLSQTVARGEAASLALCRQLAERVAASDDAFAADIIEVRIVTGDHDAVAYLTGDDREGRERIHSFCPVERTP